MGLGKFGRVISWKNCKKWMRRCTTTQGGFHGLGVPWISSENASPSDELSAFADMKFNVDNMKIIQLGITLSDENGIIAGTWEFNFKFLIETEVFYDPKSIEFLKESGIDFEELRINGIDQLFFSNMFTHVLSRHRDLKWLTFHGLYDLAYMVKLVTKKPLPYMARLYDDLHRGELGLEKLAKILGVKRVGGSHQAGSDSLLTARVFARMKTMYGIEESRFVGFLHGVTTRICEPVRTQVLPTFPLYCEPGIPQLCQVLPAYRYCRPMIHGVFLHPPIIQHQYRTAKNGCGVAPPQGGFHGLGVPWISSENPRRSDELSAFADMKFNVDNMKIIQLGITLSDENGIIAGTWEFNFKFLIETEVFYDPKSIEFLKESGIDFEELRINGIDQLFFSNMFTHVLSRHRDLKWLTFHGLYDLAYMVKLVTKKPLPVSMLDFTEIIATVFGCCVLDVKYMARLYDDLHRGELGLEKLAKILGVKRVGGSHHAGSDSLLTARVFARMKTMYGIEESRFGVLVWRHH
ncbi:hypothetical protein GH714_024729 [Hevea brasiliensis]|uniref:poly(A)-specific ribonuclease n=1 Tax=Hevea brasiliensis TaxID=3981 RepID=A0A6A6KVM3_HEVBR|nr:hypothetical protein GH714_024729 [Hevea brasiliensis]